MLLVLIPNGSIHWGDHGNKSWYWHAERNPKRLTSHANKTYENTAIYVCRDVLRCCSVNVPDFTKHCKVLVFKCQAVIFQKTCMLRNTALSSPNLACENSSHVKCFNGYFSYCESQFRRNFFTLVKKALIRVRWISYDCTYLYCRSELRNT
jgi:hypothetical protein